MRLLRAAILAVFIFLTPGAYGRLVLHYPLNETSGTRATDFSGNGKHGRIFGSPQFGVSNGLRLDGRGDYVQLPNDLMRGLASLTVSIDVYLRQEQSNYYFIYGIGNTGSNGQGNGYVFVTGTPLRAAISPSNYDSEAQVGGAHDLPREQWKTITFCVNSTAKTLALYLDGVFQGGYNTNSHPMVSPASIGSGSTTASYIGRSLYTTDRYLSGSVRNFRLWDTALSAQEVVNNGQNPQTPDAPIPGSGSQAPSDPNEANRVADALSTLTVANLDDVRGNLSLPSSWKGLPVSWSSDQPSVISNDGVVRRPSNGDVVVTLVATITSTSVQGQRSFKATVRRAGT
ncbi:concanavalin A-like lectin/glucanase [Thozetella sp. PMI_491]|nr:concanavalin A-like lectin/glucanase [Thozetella sp. PMI_491]